MSNIRHSIIFYFILLLGMGRLSANEPRSRELNYGALRVGASYDFEARLDWVGADMVVLDVKSGCTCLSITTFPELLKMGDDNLLKLKYLPVEQGAARFAVQLWLADAGGGDARWEEWTFVAWSSDVVSHELDAMLSVEEIPEIAPLEIMNHADNYLLVDVRGRNAYDAMRIPNSLQADLNDMPFQPAFKERDIVLIDSGWLSLAEQEHLLRLQKAGFKLSRITGGLAGWFGAGGKLQGTWISPISLRELDLQAWSETAGAQWEIVNVSSSVSIGERRLWGQKVQNHPLGDTRDKDQDHVLGILENALRNPQRKAVLFIGDAHERTRVQAVLAKQKALPGYFLKEEPDQLLQVMNQMQSSNPQPTMHRITASSSSGAPAPGALHLTAKPSSGKCGTCPGK